MTPVDPMTEHEQELVDRQREAAMDEIRRNDWNTLVAAYRVRLQPHAYLTPPEAEQRELMLLLAFSKGLGPGTDNQFIAQCLSDYGLAFVLKALSVALEQSA